MTFIICILACPALYGCHCQIPPDGEGAGEAGQVAEVEVGKALKEAGEQNTTYNVHTCGKFSTFFVFHL